MNNHASAAVLAVLVLARPALSQWPWMKEDRMTSQFGVTNDQFGSSVALAGDLAVVGAPEKDANGITDSGAAYVFERSGAKWTESIRFTASFPGIDQEFGTSVDTDGDTVVVGASYPINVVGPYPTGRVYVYERAGSTWFEQGVLSAGGQPFENRFGCSVALDGDTLAVGARFHVRSGSSGGPSGEGAVYVFERVAGEWFERAQLTAADAASGDQLGASVSLSGDTLVAGAPNDDLQGSNEGSAYVFVRNGTTWSQQAKLLAIDPRPFDHFGDSVSISGDTVAVGAHWVDLATGGSDQGAAYVCVRNGTTWTEQAKLVASSPVNLGHFGWSVSVVGDTLAVGATGDATYSGGAVTLFSRSGTTWTEQAVMAPGSSQGAGGRAVAQDGDTVLVGHPFWDSQSNFSVGAAFTFLVASGAPSGVNYCTAGISSGGCQAQLSAHGTPSASAATGFHLVGQGIQTPTSATAFFGTNGRKAVSWGNGTSYLCVVAPARRAGVRSPSGSGCGGSFVQDLHRRWNEKPHHNPGAGATVQAQLWYRDAQNTSNKTSALSDAVEFVVGP